MVSAGLAVSACRTGDGAGVAATTTTGANTTTTVLVTVPGAVRTATGAGGAPRDDRIGPPANGRPSDGTLDAGTCFNESLAEANGEVRHLLTKVRCEQPHDGEVFLASQLAGAPEALFAGDREVGRVAGVTCLSAFEPYVGKEYATSRLRIAILRPTESTWAKGDRAVVCTLYDTDLAPLIGPKRASGA